MVDPARYGTLCTGERVRASGRLIRLLKGREGTVRGVSATIRCSGRPATVRAGSVSVPHPAVGRLLRRVRDTPLFAKEYTKHEAYV
eukprot:gene10038-biopygen1628